LRRDVIYAIQRGPKNEPPATVGANCARVSVARDNVARRSVYDVMESIMTTNCVTTMPPSLKV